MRHQAEGSRLDRARVSTMNRPPRFAVKRKALDNGIARVGGSELHHMRNVTRLAPGAEVRLLDDEGIEYAGRIERFETDHALIAVSAVGRPASSVDTIVILAAALIRSSRMDFLVEKAAEIGAAELWPLCCNRSVVRDPGAERIMRWRRLATAAAKQSLAAHIIAIRPPLSVANLVRTTPKDALAITCTPGAQPLTTVIRRTPRPRAIVIACGPEGDFDAAETSVMLAGGFIAAALGAHRLRSETAALAALSITAGVLDELNRGS
jgi:16S rRNA (uracil1498-N3)-methyltransferase